MNVDTGKIESFSQSGGISGNYVMFDEESMTAKQKKTNQVSKYDNKSYLGHIYTEHRKTIGAVPKLSPKEQSRRRAKRLASKQSRKKNR
jgi:hypothetical protein